MTVASPVTLGGGTPAIDIVRGEGLYVWDSSGDRYLDCTSQSWALYLGHSNEELRRHASATMDRLWHIHQGFATSERERFANDLLDLVPGNGNKDMYSHVAYTATSGLAIETAIKLCMLQGSGRDTIARLSGAFHGTTLGTAQASWPANPEVEPERRTLSTFRSRGGTYATLTFPETIPLIDTDSEAGQAGRHLDRLDAELDDLSADLLAVIVEPIQGSGGQRILPKWWLSHLCQRADRDGFFVIFDEIQTYMRAGRYYTWPEDLRPHFIVLGKGLCGGFAAGAVLLRSDLRPFPVTGTYD
ncbi:aminotransferase class III-fold pyridoxal phosphate-dependent enzyme, partial [Paenarthrobacter sp. CM16]|uniref:aminotransferase class III-fold pyridoxal phosphate-dependent enzyme n=1 Tax=Paenarthrobacter sp. CM16 TaxID=2738447 RepID=UPI001557F18E